MKYHNLMVTQYNSQVVDTLNGIVSKIKEKRCSIMELSAELAQIEAVQEIVALSKQLPEVVKEVNAIESTMFG